MIEYSQRRFGINANLTDENRAMREYGWVYFDSIIDTNGTTVRYVRDTDMPYYAEVRDAYNDYISVLKQKEDLKAPVLRRGKKNVCMAFVIISAICLLVAFIGLIIFLADGDGETLYLLFGLIGLPFFIVFLINLVNVKKYYNRALIAYRSKNTELKRKIIQCSDSIAPYADDEEINEFLEKLETRIRKTKEF